MSKRITETRVCQDCGTVNDFTWASGEDVDSEDLLCQKCNGSTEWKFTTESPELMGANNE